MLDLKITAKILATVVVNALIMTQIFAPGQNASDAPGLSPTAPDIYAHEPVAVPQPVSFDTPVQGAGIIPESVLAEVVEQQTPLANLGEPQQPAITEDAPEPVEKPEDKLEAAAADAAAKAALEEERRLKEKEEEEEEERKKEEEKMAKEKAEREEERKAEETRTESERNAEKEATKELEVDAPPEAVPVSVREKAEAVLQKTLSFSQKLCKSFVATKRALLSNEHLTEKDKLFAWAWGATVAVAALTLSNAVLCCCMFSKPKAPKKANLSTVLAASVGVDDNTPIPKTPARVPASDNRKTPEAMKSRGSATKNKKADHRK